MHNNRSYHQERMFVADMAARAERDVSRVGIGNDLTDPNIDYASLAKAYGMVGIGPIERAADLGPALKKALDVVRRGEPALVDVVSRTEMSEQRDETCRNRSRRCHNRHRACRCRDVCSRPRPRRSGNATNGKQLFENQNCYYCHGTAGQGGRDGARIAATALTVAQFTRYVRRPAGAMPAPAYTAKLLTDEQLADV